ncbi:L-serine ammonia-lyase [Salmonella enterica]|nr:L-serine ammonia-lyase [Salmonella enterica]
MITHISPLGSMDMLSQLEVDMLKRTASSDLYQLFRNCSLAVLNSGSLTDNSKELLSRFENFDINVLRRERGVKLELINPPEDAFVDGRIIRALQANLFAVLRDILFVNGQIHNAGRFQHLDLESSAHITNLVFSILRNARALHVGEAPNMVVCWGGHSINENEYLYARRVGTQLGLRELNICTGCGPGAMEAPMKGAAVGHAQQRYKDSRFIGMTEPSIIAAEPPNPLVNELIIMPDIEKRLEAFVRIAHGIIIFPGGVGTAEELLYLLGILMNPANKNQVLPLILTGPKESADYFRVLDEFITHTLGEAARRHYRIIIDDAAEVARLMKKAMPLVKENRRDTGDAYSFNWSIRISPDLQVPFEPSHDNMANLKLYPDQPVEILAADLRRAFSGIVAGNVKEVGIRAIEANGPYKIHGDREMMRSGIERGITTEGVLPGKLRVPRRAAALRRMLVSQDKTTTDPMAVVDWINMFALAVNEENAAGGRVVTAPTNGACGIVPAVLAYYDKFIREVNANSLARYMLVASAIGSLYKMNASISGAEVGCQGEVGVACSMAAAGLAELLGGSPAQVCIAAEIAMEHNLGLTCDPVAGQVQVPCIERNAIASVKAVNAARMALRRTSEPRVCLDKVIETMYETGKDMNAKYRETSRGGLAMKIVTCD